MWQHKKAWCEKFTTTDIWWNNWRKPPCALFNLLCNSLMMRRRRRNWDESRKFKILKRGQGENVTVTIERWDGRDVTWQRAGGVLLGLSSCGRPPGLPVKASSVSPELWWFPWGWTPGSELPEQINREEVLRLTTISPSHMYISTSFKRNTHNSALKELIMAAFDTYTPLEGR